MFAAHEFLLKTKLKDVHPIGDDPSLGVVCQEVAVTDPALLMGWMLVEAGVRSGGSQAGSEVIGDPNSHNGRENRIARRTKILTPVKREAQE